MTLLIVSGLAYGIDTLAHRAALKNNLQTIAVLGNGLDMIYPPENSGLSRQIIQSGGLLSQFNAGVRPDRFRFPMRNRLLTLLSDATVIIKSDLKGGSLITAEEVFINQKHLFAFPGRSTDSRSAGCNELIRTGKAILITGASQLLEKMGWMESPKVRPACQPELFTLLSDDERNILKLMKTKEILSFDEIIRLGGPGRSDATIALLNLELQSLIQPLPGKSYKLA